MKYYDEFSNWLETHLSKEMPEEIIAYNFNIYEGSDSTWHIELIGAGEFDENDPDWVCNEVYTTRNDLFIVPRSETNQDWEQCLTLNRSLIKMYLEKGKLSEKLKSSRAVAFGFVDGDLEIIYCS